MTSKLIEELAQNILDTEYIGIDPQTGPLCTNVTVKDLRKISPDIILALKLVDDKFIELAKQCKIEILNNCFDNYEICPNLL